MWGVVTVGQYLGFYYYEDFIALRPCFHVSCVISKVYQTALSRCHGDSDGRPIRECHSSNTPICQLSCSDQQLRGDPCVRCSPGDGCQWSFLRQSSICPSLCILSAGSLGPLTQPAGVLALLLTDTPWNPPYGPHPRGKAWGFATVPQKPPGVLWGLPQQIAHMFKDIDSALIAANSPPLHPPSPASLLSCIIWFSHSIVFSPVAVDMG